MIDMEWCIVQNLSDYKTCGYVCGCYVLNLVTAVYADMANYDAEELIKHLT